MKRLPFILLVLLLPGFLYSQKCNQIFSVSIPARQLVFVNKTHTFYGIGNDEYTSVDYTTGDILAKQTYNIKEKYYAQVNDITSNVIVCDYKHTLLSVNLDSGNTAWEITDFNDIEYRSVFENYILVFDKLRPKFPITCIDSHTGKVLWKKDNLNNFITRDMVDSYGKDEFLIDFETTQSKIRTHNFTVISALTGESKYSFVLNCKKTLFYRDYQIFVSNNALYTIHTDIDGTILTKADFEKKGIDWTHKINLPFFQFDTPTTIGKSKITDMIEIEVIDKNVFVKTNEGFEIVNDSTGVMISSHQLPIRAKEFFDMKWVALSEKPIIVNDFAYMPYFINKEQFISKLKGSLVTANYYLKKIKYSDNSELWTTDLGERLYLRNLYNTDSGILAQFGGIAKTTEGLVPFQTYSLILLDAETGNKLWTIDAAESLYSLVFENKSTIVLLTSKSIKKIDLASGKELYSAPFDAIRYYTTTDQYGKQVTTQSDLNNYYIDIDKKIIVYFPYDNAAVTGYKFE